MLNCRLLQIIGGALWVIRALQEILLWIIISYVCFVFVILSCLLVEALWSPAGKVISS